MCKKCLPKTSPDYVLMLESVLTTMVHAATHDLVDDPLKEGAHSEDGATVAIDLSALLGRAHHGGWTERKDGDNENSPLGAIPNLKVGVLRSSL